MDSSTQNMRQAWASFECRRKDMVRIPFGPDLILVAPPTIDAWKALERVLREFKYDIRIEDTDSYNCRNIKGGTEKSLHSYGIALDINWHTNPFIDHSSTRPPRFSNKLTQRERGQDVRLGKADTDMTREMIDAVLAIRTNAPDPKQVFDWGGYWETIKDSMHFQIQVTPAELAKGINWNTVAGGPAERDEEELVAVRQDDDNQMQAMPWPEVAIDHFPQPESIALREGDTGPMVTALQSGLVALNYPVGAIDGDFGTLTRDALLSFQANNGLPTTGVADAETLSMLSKGRPRVLSLQRVTATEADLQKKGSEVINASGWNRWLGIGTGILGALGLADSQLHFVTRIGDALKVGAGATNGTVDGTQIRSAVDKVLATASADEGPATLVKAVQDAVGNLATGTTSILPQNSGGAFIEPVISLLQTLLSASGAGPWAMLIGAGVFIWRNARKAADARVADHRTGANVSR